MLSIVATVLLSAPSITSDPVELVVHEWGTFTSMQGSDGVPLAGLNHEEEPLPEFVHAIDGFTAIDTNMALKKGIGRPILGCTVKMETPVTYFYSPRSLLVHAHVELEHGMLTQWYPAVAEFGARGAPKEETIDFTKVERGWLDWQLDVLTHLFVLNVRNGRGEFSYVPRIEPGASVKVERPLAADAPSIDAMIGTLAPQLAAALVASGLFEPEARAMVETWKHSYFQTPGLRVLYVVPSRITNALLPLEISPKPRETVRILVGRLECIAPECERDLQQSLLRFVEGNEEQRSASWDHMAKLDRFLEPNLRRAIALATDARIAELATRWLD